MYKLTITHRLKREDDITPEEKKKNAKMYKKYSEFDKKYGNFIIKPTNPYFIPKTHFYEQIPIGKNEKYDWNIVSHENNQILLNMNTYKIISEHIQINKDYIIYRFPSFAGTYLTLYHNGKFAYDVHGSGLPTLDYYSGTWKKI